MTLNYSKLNEQDFKTIISVLNTNINVLQDEAVRSNVGDKEWEYINDLTSIVTKIQLELAESKFHGRL